MQTYQKASIQKDMTSVLIIGDAREAFADYRQLDRPDCRQCDNILDGIALAAAEDFGIILIVMSSFARQLDSALEAFGRTGRRAKIILLAQMHEEPRAREIIGRRSPTASAVYDYLICPVKVGVIFNGGGAVEQATAGQMPAVTTAGGTTQARIRELEKLAMQDDLTSLKNRRYVREFLRQILIRARKDNLRVTLLVFDIDDFKHYNDAYGHPVGDNVLRQAAAMMLRCCREHDVVGRIGGDEFAVVFWDLPETAGKTDAAKDLSSERRQTKGDHPRQPLFMAERFRKEISSAELTFLGPEGRGALTISGGLASFPKDGTTVGELFEQADRAMLEAKRSGKNRVDLVGEIK